jgi:hypothetical protein
MSLENDQAAGSARMIKTLLGDGLEPGELGILLARAGGGKTACLTHIALEYLLQGIHVLHVCIDEKPDAVKTWYHELLKNIAAGQAGWDVRKLQTSIEPLRFILTYSPPTFSPSKLALSLLNLKEQARFVPSLVVLDGLDFDRVNRTIIEDLQKLARREAVAIWLAARTHRHRTAASERGIPYPCHEMDDLFRAIILLEPTGDAIRLAVLKHRDRYMPAYPPLFLNPQTFLLQ